MKEKKGVTLIALVITIIIIMILASIAIYSGASTIRYAKYNKAKSEIQVIQSYVNEWYKEYQKAEDKNTFLGDYGELIGTAIDNGKCTQEQIDSTFAGGGITDNNKKSNYRFFSENFFKEETGLDASFDYLISIKDRNTILYNGVVYNKEIYYTLDDFGLQNIKQVTPNSIGFYLEQGDNTDIIISNLQLDYLGASNKSDISKFYVEYKKIDETDWTDATKNVVKFEDDGEIKFKFSVPDYAQYIVKILTIDKKEEESNDIILEARHGIKVGDYIKYTSPTETVSLSTTETGYSSTQTLSRKDTFRVMDIDESGNMTLMGAMTSSDTRVFFQGALGYNNAVYTLNNKCSDLYKDTSRGITARSIKVEDITSKFNNIGNEKLATYISDNIPKSTGTYINSIDINNKTVTYKNRTYYPDIFQYEEGAVIDGTHNSEVIGQSESYSGYGGITDLLNNQATNSLTIPYTYYSTSHEAEDFANSSNAAAYQDMFFETNTYYWLASRCSRCYLEYARFGIRIIKEDGLYAYGLYRTDNNDDNHNYSFVCPIVYIPSSVHVDVSENPKNQTNTNGTLHEVK